MPIIRLDAVHPTKDQKERLIADLTNAASNVLGVAPEYFYVVINEHELEDWGVGGKSLEQFLADMKK